MTRLWLDGKNIKCLNSKHINNVNKRQVDIFLMTGEKLSKVVL